jgi:response regulator RpfG family c-di-GMP phosphodiesterase
MKKKVLLIDDDREEYELFCKGLHEYHPHISCVHLYNCSNLEKELNGESVSWIFLDFNLPMYNGHQCVQKIKKIPSLQNVPLYMFSASKVDKIIQDLCMECGAVAWIKKPNNVEGYKKIFEEVFT